MSKRPLTRREFVAATAAAAAVGSYSPVSLAELTMRPDLRLDAGYILGTDQIAGLGAWAEPYMGEFSLVRADSFGQGDPRFLRSSARLSIVEFVAPADTPSLLIRAHFDVRGLPDGESSIAFDAWGHDAKTKQTSRAIAFDVPILPERGVRLTLDVGEPKRTAPRVRPLRPGRLPDDGFNGLELSLSGDGPKLRRGIYIFGVVAEPVTWSSYRFVARDPEVPGRALVRSTLTGRDEARFPYFVVIVDHVATG